MCEDFGFYGDERLLGDCMEDWAMERFEMGGDDRDSLREDDWSDVDRDFWEEDWDGEEDISYRDCDLF